MAPRPSQTASRPRGRPPNKTKPSVGKPRGRPPNKTKPSVAKPRGRPPNKTKPLAGKPRGRPPSKLTGSELLIEEPCSDVVENPYLARIALLDSQTTSRPDPAVSTSRNRKTHANLWQRFCSQALQQKEYKQALLDASAGTIKCYFEWVLERDNNRIQTLSSIKQYKSELGSLRLDWSFELRGDYQQVSKQVSVEVNRFLENDLFKTKELTAKPKEKLTFGRMDMSLALKFLWSFDDFIYPLERFRLQMALGMLIMGSTGVRPGTLFHLNKAGRDEEDESDEERSESDEERPKSDEERIRWEAITYRDLRVNLVTTDEGRTTIRVKISFRFYKGRKDQAKSQAYTSSPPLKSDSGEVYLLTSF
ncbi:hypothetical protein TWF281_002163 [Arthrobotrys megalospora]